MIETGEYMTDFITTSVYKQVEDSITRIIVEQLSDTIWDSLQFYQMVFLVFDLLSIDIH